MRDKCSINETTRISSTYNELRNNQLYNSYGNNQEDNLVESLLPLFGTKHRTSVV